MTARTVRRPDTPQEARVRAIVRDEIEKVYAEIRARELAKLRPAKPEVSAGV